MGHIEKHFSDKDIDKIKEMAVQCRGDVLKMTTLANSGHPGGSMSSMEMYLAVYHFANVFPKSPWKKERDRVVISHGHTSPGVYSVLGRMGYFNVDDAIAGFRHVNTIFEGHITRGIPGVEWTTGNLGQGLSAGLGFSLAAMVKKMEYRTYVIMGDAEQAKGQVAEARRTASKYKTSDITVLIDVNDAQINGRTQDVMPVNIKENYLSDGWEVLEVNGHDFRQLFAALNKAAANTLTPTVILCYTQIGHGISFMENDAGYHGKALSEKQLFEALDELKLEYDLEKYKEMRNKLPIKAHEKTLLEYKPEIKTGEPKTYRTDVSVDNRSAFGNALKDLGVLNDKSATPISVVDCDLLPSTKTGGFAKACPDNFFQFGVAEHNAAACSGAMSVEEVVTFFTDFGIFGIDETYNQQRLNDINHANLKLAVTHVGTDTGEDGKTHHCLDYVGGPANFFHFHTIVPGDPNQTDRAVRYATEQYGNYLIAVGRSKLHPLKDINGNPFFAGDYTFEYGKVDEVRETRFANAIIIAMGATLPEAVKAADKINKDGIKVGVLNCSCPLVLWKQRQFLEEKLTNKIVLTVEDHNIWTGLGAMLEDAITRNDIKVTAQYRLGIDDYSVSGCKEDLFKLFKIDAEGIELELLEILG
ncbi:MAG: transketolase [Thermotogota bacterium]|nr:transketolase [Thermotogota bacterium]